MLRRRGSRGRTFRRLGWSRDRRRVWLIGLLLLEAACSAERPPAQPLFAGAARSSPLRFQYELADQNGWLGSESLRGQPTVITFITTYDLASQAQARFLSGVWHRHGSGLRAAAIFLERPENRPLIVAFRDALGLGYPVALGDPALIAGDGPFGDVHAVPSTIVLDGEARMVWKKIGLAKEDEIENALRGL